MNFVRFTMNRQGMWAGGSEYRLRHTNAKYGIPRKDLKHIHSLYDWFDNNLKTPTFCSYNGWRRFWFKSTSDRHVKKACELAEILSKYFSVYEWKTNSPGNIVYEDDHQVAVNNRINEK